MFQNLHFAIRKIGAGLAMLTFAGSYLYAQQGPVVGEISVSDRTGETGYYSGQVQSQEVVQGKKTQLSKNGLTCNNTDPGSSPGDTGCVTFTYQGQPVTYTSVRGRDGNIWLQQNLGSSKVASEMGDEASFGDLFQWGRWDDGHQLRNSATANPTTPNSPNGLAGSNAFIVGDPDWWANFADTDKWTAANTAGVTNSTGVDPCKAVGPEWKLPSQAEWTAIVNSENIVNPGTAYNSQLKLPASGYRSSSNGSFTFVGKRGYYWSSETSGMGGKYLYIGTIIANPSAGAMRGQGSAVRCIKTGSALGTSDIIRPTETVGIYPNPTNGIVHVKADSLIESVNVINMVGQKLNNIQFSNNQININGLPNGLYMIELKLKNGHTISKKIIKN